MKEKIPMYVGDKKVGYIDVNEKTYVTRRNPARHFFRKFNGYAISYNILKTCRDKGVTCVIIQLAGRNRLKSFLCDWFKHGEEYVYQAQMQLVLHQRFYYGHECKQKDLSGEFVLVE